MFSMNSEELAARLKNISKLFKITKIMFFKKLGYLNQQNIKT